MSWHLEGGERCVEGDDAHKPGDDEDKGEHRRSQQLVRHDAARALRRPRINLSGGEAADDSHCRLDVSWTCRGRVVDVSWACRGRVVDVSWACRGHVVHVIRAAAWLPAFPPAPTSIVMKKMTVGCSSSRDSFSAWRGRARHIATSQEPLRQGGSVRAGGVDCVFRGRSRLLSQRVGLLAHPTWC